MHTSFLKYFDEVARQRSIRKAAAILNISSTTVNRKIIGVERSLGVQLFERTPEGVELTEIGNILLEHCRKTLHDFDRAKVMMDDLRDLRTGHINLQTLDSVAYGVLPEAIEKFRLTFPDISLSVTTAMPDEIMAAVANGSADVGISFLLDLHPNVRVVSEKPAPFGIIARPDHPLAHRNSVSLEDLKDFRLIRTVDARGQNSIIDQRVSNLAAPLSTHVFTNTLYIAKRMILDNQGIGIYTKIGFYNEVESGDLAFVPLIAEGLSNIRVGLLVSASQGIDGAKHALCGVVNRALRNMKLDS